MGVLRDGTFSFNIGPTDLSAGLRPSKRSPRNAKFLVSSVGAVGLDNVLQVLDDIENDRLDTSLSILDSFPYPQIFVFTNLILVCGETDIYEYDGSLTKVIGPVASGELWSAIDLHNFIYLSNRTVSILRDPGDGTYSLTSDQPVAAAICNFNGQVIVGSPLEI
jgi:hypothetical protein